MTLVKLLLALLNPESLEGLEPSEQKTSWVQSSHVLVKTHTDIQWEAKPALILTLSQRSQSPLWWFQLTTSPDSV